MLVSESRSTIGFKKVFSRKSTNENLDKLLEEHRGGMLKLVKKAKQESSSSEQSFSYDRSL